MKEELLVEFRVFGVPRPGGSKKSFVPGLRAGMAFDPSRHRPVVVEDCKRNKEWRESVKEAALSVYSGPSLDLTTTLKLEVVFWMPRPTAHFRSGAKANELRLNAPYYHTTKPDATKLLRSTEDALTGVLWQDDSRIAFQLVEKRYATTAEKPGALIIVSRFFDNEVKPDAVRDRDLFGGKV